MTLAKIRSESQAQECRCVVRRLSLPRRSKTVRQLVAQHPLRLRQNLPLSLNRPSRLRQKQTSCTISLQLRQNLPLSLNRPSPLRQTQASCIINLQNPRFGGALWSLMRIIPSEIGRKAADTLGRRQDLESSRAAFGIDPWTTFESCRTSSFYPPKLARLVVGELQNVTGFCSSIGNRSSQTCLGH